MQDWQHDRQDDQPDYPAQNNNDQRFQQGQQGRRASFEFRIQKVSGGFAVLLFAVFIALIFGGEQKAEPIQGFDQKWITFSAK